MLAVWHPYYHRADSYVASWSYDEFCYISLLEGMISSNKSISILIDKTVSLRFGYGLLIKAAI